MPLPSCVPAPSSSFPPLGNQEVSALEIEPRTFPLRAGSFPQGNNIPTNPLGD